MPSVLVERASASGHGLRFSLSVSLYHAGSKRFYGDTFMGELLDEEDEERVEIVSERRQGASSSATKGNRKVMELHFLFLFVAQFLLLCFYHSPAAGSIASQL